MRFIILFIFLSTSFLGFAQNQVIFNEKFENNANKWSINDNENISSEIKDSYFFLSHKRESGSWYFWKSFFFDQSKDFTIESLITQTEGNSEAGFGLIWGCENADNLYGFLIASSGYFEMYSYNDGKYIQNIKWTKSSYIKSINKPNLLTIQKRGNRVNLLVNNEQVTSIPFETFFGINFGFAIHNKIDIKIDYITVKQDGFQINLVKNPINGYKKENLGMGINSQYDEIMPVISPDGKKLFFTRKDHPQNKGEIKKDDVWFSEIKSDNTWGNPVHMGFPINNEGYNSVISVLPDGNTLLLMNTYFTNGTPNKGGVSLSKKESFGWSVPRELTIEDFYNNDDYSEYCLSTDQNILLLAAGRDDTYGQRDIYVCFKQGSGFSKPLNIGNVVNSPFNEISPFLAADNTTLYFSSNGYPGYGNNDIYITHRLDDTWTNWSVPQNLGPEINTTAWDAYYSVPASGEYAYIASNQFSKTYQSDLYRIKVAEYAKPKPVVLIQGKVLDKKTKKPVNASIQYELLKKAKILGTASSNPQTGEYKIILNYGQFYGFQAKARGYFPVSENIDLVKINTYTEITKDLYLVPIENGEVIVLKNVFFEQGKTTILEESYPELNRLVQLMKDNPKMKIELSGHTENRGDRQKLIKLSENRVYTVKNYLVSKGINETRISGLGYGPDKPIATNDTDDGRKQNRRVEFKIIKVK